MNTLSSKALLDSLIASKALSNDDAVRILQTHLRKKISVLELLEPLDGIKLGPIAHSIARNTKLPLLDITKVSQHGLPLQCLTAEFAQSNCVVPLQQNADKILVAISDPQAIPALQKFSQEKKLSLEIAIAEHSALKSLVQTCFPSVNVAQNSSLESDAKTPGKISNFNSDLSDSKLDKIDFQLDETSLADTSEFPVVRFINKIILDSIKKNASDIHFEPFENTYRIRIRVDGMLHGLAEPDGTLAPRLSARIKVRAGLDISERRIPQDGRFKINLGKGKTIGFRVNTCPTLFGEKIVLRILDPQTVNVGVDGLGFDDEQKKVFLETIHKNQGMLLVTGPTGSGKTVTLYTALNMLNSTEKNISTAEDPVEIYLPGINQVNINPKTGLDFASVLRAFLRQDPDIIMLGEIRDHETAEIAMKAAQTGHFVLSTLHTNSAAETLTRMENMGTSSFNIASSVSLVIAQRLVRKLCEKCKQPSQVNRAVLIEQGFDPNELNDFTVYAPKDCKECTAGYKGRIAIFEVLLMTPEICDVIMNKGTSIDIYNKAVDEGMLSLRQSGLNKVRLGVTSLEEINRVTS